MKKEALAQVKKAIKKWPAYRRFIESKGVVPSRVEDISDLPVIDKRFISQAINTVPLFKIKSILPSSGSTGADFSFGLFGDGELKKTAMKIEEFLRSRFNTKSKKTLILNMLPGAISLRFADAAVANIGIRTDTAIHAIKTLGSSFEQIILIGEPLFIKDLIETGTERSILWRYMSVSAIVGGEWISEGYRNYLEGIIGSRRVYSSMGMAELGLHCFYETDETIMLRNLLFEDSRLLKMFFGGMRFCPMIFAYDEDNAYVETIKEPLEEFESILLTATDRSRVLPLIRYKGGDKGSRLSRAEINNGLRAMGYGALLGADGPPLLAHFGRGKNISGIYAEEVKDIIYSAAEVASKTTGNFALSGNKGGVELAIQLKEGIFPDDRIVETFCEAFGRLPAYIKLYPFSRFPCPLNFERKVCYVNEGNNSAERRREEIKLSAAV
jgi:phenylacetate-coenzyme A ligase PaaK-like adenylate-forming protein